MSSSFATRRRRVSVAPLTLDRFAAGVGPHTLETLRAIFLALIEDLDEPVRTQVGERIQRARRIDDFWHLRPALFAAISMVCGEQVARLRLAEFDARWQ